MALQESVTARNNRVDAEEFGALGPQANASTTWAAWSNNIAYTQFVSWVWNDTAPIKVYMCITSGTSGAAGAGPTGYGQNITDNTAHWSFIGNWGIGPTPLLGLFTGAPPANCATANSGTLICTMTLPAAWMNVAGSGAKSKVGTWQNTSAGGTGTIGYFRIYDVNGICHYQGTCTNTGGGGDMTFDNTVVNAGQQITVNTFVITAGNA